MWWWRWRSESRAQEEVGRATGPAFSFCTEASCLILLDKAGHHISITMIKYDKYGLHGVVCQRLTRQKLDTSNNPRVKSRHVFFCWKNFTGDTGLKGITSYLLFINIHELFGNWTAESA
jgi:hypothetical protein